MVAPTIMVSVNAWISVIFRYVRVLILGQSGTPVPTTCDTFLIEINSAIAELYLFSSLLSLLSSLKKRPEGRFLLFTVLKSQLSAGGVYITAKAAANSRIHPKVAKKISESLRALAVGG